MRLIDADVLEAKLKKLMKKYARLARIEVAEDYNFVITVLSIAPNIDAVPVVRCRDCKMHYPEDAKHCEHCALTGVSVDGDAFCSYGERKDNANRRSAEV